MLAGLSPQFEPVLRRPAQDEMRHKTCARHEVLTFSHQLVSYKQELWQELLAEAMTQRVCDLLVLVALAFLQPATQRKAFCDPGTWISAEESLGTWVSPSVM